MFFLDRSIDGLSFQRISEIPSKGNSRYGNSYTFTDKDVKTGQMYYYRLADYSLNGQVLYHPMISITFKASGFLPERMLLHPNYPNPFNPTTIIKYELPKPEKVKIEIFTLLGKKIKTLLNKQMTTGIHEIEFNGQNLPSGVYYYRIAAGKFQHEKKMILLR